MYGSNRSTPERRRLRESFEDVMEAAEDLLAATTSETNAEYRKVRDALEARVGAAKERIRERARDVADETREIGRRGDEFVHVNPWTSIGIGAGVGLLLGLVLRRH
ncbi:DUF883 family protein [Dokdonella immobilis]|uniref:Membrane-anchored ribosome-binding protein, inhibits growth in stationary phase, ElaB/YqjD/DUF883 family n=1 Tax=Dokdonella immobilis TaxID=578942 RepID=A0A1I4ZAR7_9GAMM|nr:DUF883 family protein [Dokdonella immobilis]SFN47365.1 Membrane-anchored ribosome-binding protein, inhibits growth in stationary phase, ElaB/YqjD/DUF883 family [Dokdonella immobilis]